MRRLHSVPVMVLVLAAACAGGTGSTTTTVATSATSTTGESTTTSAGPTSTGTPEWPGVELLVTNEDGVFYIDSTGATTQLVKGRVAYAVDDTRGGLLFQVERGRDWELSLAGPSERSQKTVVWWMPSGSSTAQALLVPTPGAGHWLSLHDAYRTEKSFSVLYTRSEGSVPFEDAWEKLRIFDEESGEAREVATVGGWEFDFVDGSVNGGLIAGTSNCWVGGTECILLTMDGELVTHEGPPTGHECREQGVGRCDYSCVVSADGRRVAYLETLIFDGDPAGETSVVVRELASGLEVERRTIGFDVPWNWSLDMDGSLVLVNRLTEYPNLREVFGGALLIDPSDGSVDELPLSGKARFTTSPLDIRGPIVSPTQAAIQLRADGLGVVDFGDPVDEVVDLMTGVLGVAESDTFDTGGAAAGVTCSERTGMACDDYLRVVVWDAWLSLVFSDVHPYDGDGPAFVGWQAWGGVERLATVDGIGPGSTVNALTTVYGDALEWIWERDCGVDFYLLPGGQGAIYGSVDDDVSMPVPLGYEPDQDSQVEWLGGGMLGDC